MLRFKIGDKVRIVRQGGGCVESDVGRKGIVTKIDEDDELQYYVTHNDTLSTKDAWDDHTWCEESILELVDEAPALSPSEGLPVTAFKAGKWYRWVGPKKRRSHWNGNSDGTGEGKMDFILDGQPHLCSFGRGTDAKFPDSPDPDYRWSWYDGFEYFREVPAPTQGVAIEKAWGALGASIRESSFGPSISEVPFVIESRADIRRRILGI